MSEYTPGPWISTNDAVPYTPKQKSLFDDIGASIKTINGNIIVEGGAQGEQGGAVGVLRNEDAYLIAAAPALLEALKEYMAAFGQALEAYGIPFGEQQSAADGMARAAIARAEGKA